MYVSVYTVYVCMYVCECVHSVCMYVCMYACYSRMYSTQKWCVSVYFPSLLSCCMKIPVSCFSQEVSIRPLLPHTCVLTSHTVLDQEANSKTKSSLVRMPLRIHLTTVRVSKVVVRM